MTGPLSCVDRGYPDLMRVGRVRIGDEAEWVGMQWKGGVLIVRLGVR